MLAQLRKLDPLPHCLELSPECSKTSDLTTLSKEKNDLQMGLLVSLEADRKRKQMLRKLWVVAKGKENKQEREKDQTQNGPTLGMSA